MGIDASDYDGDGQTDLVIGNFSNEMVSLYHNEGVGFFIDQAPVSEIGRNSLLTPGLLGPSSSTTTSTAARTSSSPTDTSRTTSPTSSKGLPTGSLPICSETGETAVSTR